MTRFRSWLLLFLVMHLLVHPMVHALCASSTVAHSTTVALPGDSSTAVSLEDCSLCRAGHGAFLWADLRQVERLNPLWNPIRLKAVSDASLGVPDRLPSRAPPSL